MSMSLEELYTSTYNQMVKNATRKLGSFWAEDAVQDTFEKLIPIYDPERATEPKAFAFLVLKQQVNKYRKIMSGTFVEVEEDSKVLQCESPFDEEIVIQHFNHIIKDYPLLHRQVLYSRCILGLPHEQITKIIDVSLANVNQIITRFRYSIRSMQ